jgi:tetratricopeptide (TPR) repeat protein
LTHAEANLANALRLTAELHQSAAPGSSIPAMSQCLSEYGRAAVAMWRGDAASARRITEEVVGVMKSLQPKGGLETFYQNICTFSAFNVHGQAAYMLGDYAGAERAARDALEARARWPVQNDQERRDRAEASIGLALALARQGRAAQALEVINPVVKLQRELAARNHGDQWQQLELASALYVEALCDPVRRAALLKEAATLVNSVPAAMRSLHSVRRWHDRIVPSLREGNAAMAASAVGRSAG